jgi:TonB family protein
MMTKKNKYDGLFTPSGCLTLDTLKRLEDSSLHMEEKKAIEKHLNECELCSDAVEGLKLINNPEKISSIVAEINENLNLNLTTEKLTISKRRRRITDRFFYISAAASVLILVGVFTYLKLNKPFKNDDITVISETESSDKVPPTPLPNVSGSVSKSHKENEPEMKENISSQVVVDKNDRIEPITKNTQKINDEDTELATAQETDANIVNTKTGLINEEKNEVVTELPIETGELEPVDIASVQPFEYYLGEVIIPAEKSNKDKRSTTHQQKSETAYTIDGISTKPAADRQSMVPLISKAANQEKGLNQASEKILPENIQNSEHFFKAVDTMPEFPGGIPAMNDFLKKKLHYPSLALENQIEGTVLITFTIEENGKITSVSVMRCVDSSFYEEVLRAIHSMPDWKPGYKNGIPVRVQISLPIRFQLL